MRFEQIITAVARQVVVSTVREIKAVMSFLNGGWPHFSQQRNANGVPSYANGLYLLPAHGTVGLVGRSVCMPGCSCLQPCMACADCPAESDAS